MRDSQPDTTPKRRFVPREADPLGSLAQYAMFNDWLLIEQVAPEAGIPQQLVFSKGGKRETNSTLHLVRDPIVGFAYILARGREAVDAIGELRRTVPLFSDDEILESARKAAVSSEMALDDRTLAVARLAVASPTDFEPLYFEAFRAALASPEPAVRRAAVWHTGYPGWPQFRGPLEQIRDADPEPELREAATKMLDAITAVHGPQSP
jgi:hypothetical protein